MTDQTKTGRFPDFIVIGAPRSGTTALTRYLGEHPQIFMSDPKELWYFTNRGMERGEDWYTQHFAAAGRDRLAGEGTTLYMFLSEAMTRISRTIPHCRLVALLRHPVDRAWSHYWFQHEWGSEKRPFEQAVSDELGGRAQRGDQYLAMGHYADQIAHIDRLFPEGALLIEVFDDLRASPKEVFRRVCVHLGADPEVVPSIVGERINAIPEVRSHVVQRASKRLRGAGPLLSGAGRRLDALNRREFRRPSLDPALRAQLLEHFEEPNAKLRERLGRDLSGWDR
jgi:sulfotransferase family protein